MMRMAPNAGNSVEKGATGIHTLTPTHSRCFPSCFRRFFSPLATQTIASPQLARLRTLVSLPFRFVAAYSHGGRVLSVARNLIAGECVETPARGAAELSAQSVVPWLGGGGKKGIGV